MRTRVVIFLGVLIQTCLLNLAHALPVYKYEDVFGKPVTLEEKKNKQLVVFWATWCSECKGKLTTTLPELNQNPEVDVITVNADEDRERAADYVTKNRLQIPVIRDLSQTLLKDLKVIALPFWVVYTRTHEKSFWTLKDSAVAFDLARVKKALDIK
ncbi:MAG: TlpA disulfide reductase family protein [Oligoflexia bacterium]|nr:TlpA disulfide reductase family protein [Oligoflexia bacterium]